MNIKIYELNVWMNKKITYDIKKGYTIDDSSDYLLMQIHKILNKGVESMLGYKFGEPIQKTPEELGREQGEKLANKLIKAIFGNKRG